MGILIGLVFRGEIGLLRPMYLLHHHLVSLLLLLVLVLTAAHVSQPSWGMKDRGRLCGVGFEDVRELPRSDSSARHHSHALFLLTALLADLQAAPNRELLRMYNKTAPSFSTLGEELVGFLPSG